MQGRVVLQSGGLGHFLVLPSDAVVRGSFWSFSLSFSNGDVCMLSLMANT